ncbi:MAG: FtsW/RodA/SpoVE family cell cycle protein [Anaerolineae bacterium]|jgi:peptidoglycan glycosyltransferase
MASRILTQTQPLRAAMGTNRRERVLLILAAVFVLVGALGLHLAYGPFGLRHVAITCGVSVVTFGTTHLTVRRLLPRRDPFLLPTGALLSGWGLLVVGRVAPNFLARQATWLMLGAIAMIAVIEVGQDLRWLQRYRYTWLVSGLVLLAATLLLGVNPSGSGPRLWLGLGDVYLQPSEPLKLLMVVFVASYLAERRKLLVSQGWKVGPVRLPPPAYAGPLLVMFGLAVLLLAAQQDLGAAMLFFLTFLSMLYLATAQWGYVAAGLALFGAAGAVGYVLSARLALRVDAWLSPWEGAADWSFQIVQSLLAFGEGGFLGQGLGLGRPTYVPAVHTDFAFAAIGESFGLVGLLVVIALYGLLLLRGFRAAARAGRVFERYLAAGLTAGLVIQAWVIMAANVRLAPIAGVTLPFLSYGGSSLLSTFIVLGLLLRISGRAGQRGEGPRHWEGGLEVNRLSSDASSRQAILRTAGVLAVALAVLALVCGYWSVVRADWLVAREDNPRRVAYERRIVRGRIVDRDGEPLADVSVGPSGLVTRTYPLPEAAPVVGYATLRYGTGGMEAALDEALRGEARRGPWEETWADLLHRVPRGQDVRLTLDAGLQRRAQEALEGEAGAAVLIEVETGRVLAMASSPTFDPARLGEEWETLREDPAAPLVNRATQGLYQPGTALQTVVIAEGLSQGLIDHLGSDAGPSPTRRVLVDGVEVGCSVLPKSDTIGSAYGAGCPAPVEALGGRLRAEGLAEAVGRWRLSVPPALEIPTEASDWNRGAIVSAQEEAVGQGALTVSPLQMALVAAALGNEGTMPDPHLVAQTKAPDGPWRSVEGEGEGHSVLTAADARSLLAAWQRYESGSAPGAGGALGHWGVAVAGEGAPHAWFLGVAPADGDPRYAVAVLVEHAQEPDRGVAVGRGLLEAALREGD